MSNSFTPNPPHDPELEEIKAEIAARKQRLRDMDKERKARHYAKRTQDDRDKSAAYMRERRRRLTEQKATRPRPLVCEVCCGPPRYREVLFFDHNHTTGTFRGWLCYQCNLIIGNVNDDPVLLEKLAMYLRTHG